MYPDCADQIRLYTLLMTNVFLKRTSVADEESDWKALTGRFLSQPKFGFNLNVSDPIPTEEIFVLYYHQYYQS